MPAKPSTLEAYLATLSHEQRSTIEQMRATIVAAAPKAEAVFSYNMPGFRVNGEPLAWVAAWKRHYSLYPLTRAMIDAGDATLAKYEMEKGTLRFPASQQVPLSLIRKLVQARVRELTHAKGTKKRR